MSGLVEGKVVVVTGAGGGIGRDIALAMAASGAKVLVNDIGASLSGEGGDAGPAQQVVEEIKAAGGEAVANTDSVSEAKSASNIVQQAVDTWGRVDGVVNNAGILRDRFFHKMSEPEWDAVIKVHLYGAYYVSRAAANVFKDQESRRPRPHDLHLRADRQFRAGELLGRQARHRRALANPSRSTCSATTSAPTASRPSHGRA